MLEDVVVLVVLDNGERYFWGTLLIVKHFSRLGNHSEGNT